MREYLTLDQAAAELDLSREEVYQLVRSGTLLGAHIPEDQSHAAAGWYVEKDALEAYRKAQA